MNEIKRILRDYKDTVKVSSLSCTVERRGEECNIGAFLSVWSAKFL